MALGKEVEFSEQELEEVAWCFLTLVRQHARPSAHPRSLVSKKEDLER